MIIYIGADHRGYALKEELKAFLSGQAYTVEDKGNTAFDPLDDYPDFAAAVAREVSASPEGSRGILICHSGAGVDFVANKFPNVRSVLGFSADQVFDARHDDDVNILSLASDFIESTEAKKIVKVFLSTPFAREERFLRRLEKVARIEAEIVNLRES